MCYLSTQFHNLLFIKYSGLVYQQISWGGALELLGSALDLLVVRFGQRYGVIVEGIIPRSHDGNHIAGLTF